MEKRLCPECGEVIVGRVDKKFCSDACRNTFNNKANSDSSNFVRNVNNILRKNRRIMEDLLQGDKITLPKHKLVDKGFNFKYFTNQSTTRNGHTYIYCYEYGYLLLEHELVLIVKKKLD